MNTFFITGVQRSGTTLLSVLLSNHPDILLERRSIAFRIITCFKSLYDIMPYNLKEDRNEFLKWLIENDYKGRLAELLKTEILESDKSIVDFIQESVDLKLKKENKKIWGDKSPNLEFYFNDMELLMPKAKMLHIVRDGRAVAYSMSTRSSRNLLLSAQKWVDGNIQALVNQEIAGKERYKIIHYETLLKEPEETLRSVCEFLNIPFDLSVLNTDDEEIDENKKYVKSDFDQSKINKWKQQLTPKEIFKIEKIQGPLLQRLGYSLETASEKYKHKPLSVWQKIRYNQADSFRALFRNKRVGMVDREMVTIKIPLKSRVYAFFKIAAQGLLSTPIFKTLFSRVFYRKKYFDKNELSPEEKTEI